MTAGETDSYNDTNGTQNTYIGIQSGPNTATALQNATAIGTSSTVGESNALVLGCISGINSCTATTKVGIGTPTPSSILDVEGSQNSQFSLIVNNSNTGSSATSTIQLGASSYITQNSSSNTSNGGTNSLNINNATSGGTIAIGISGVSNEDITNTGSTKFKDSTDSASGFVVQNAGGTQILNVNSTASIVSVQGTNTDPVVGSELMTSNTNFSSGWTGSGWTFNSSSATHSSGTSPAVYSGFTPAAYSYYQITYTFAGANGTDSITPSIGGGTGQAIYDTANTDTQLIYTAAGTGHLEFTPTTGWAGHLTSVSVKLFSPSNPDMELLNSAGTEVEDLRVSTNNPSNQFIGYAAGGFSTGNYNDGVGFLALDNNTSGYSNSAFGDDALQDNTTGYYNTASGQGSLQNNTVGYDNSALGFASLGDNTTGYSNTALGYGSLDSNTYGASNVGIGYLSVFSNKTGISNTGVGYAALQNATSSYDTAIGSNAMQNATGGDGVAIGEAALDVEGGYGDIGIGIGAGTDSSYSDTAGSYNEYLGYSSGPNNASALDYSTAIGAFSEVDENSAISLGCVSGVNGCTATTEVGVGTATPTATFDDAGSALFQDSTSSNTAFQVQDATGASVLTVDTTSTMSNGNQLNYLTYPGFEVGSFTNASAGWIGVNATLTQNTTKANTYNGIASAYVQTTGTNGGLKTSSFVSAPPTATTYLVSFYAEAQTGTLASSSFTVTSTDGTTHSCSPASGTTITTSGFQRLYCQLPATTGAMTALQITYATTSTNFYVDAVQLQSNSFNGTTITVPTAYQIGAIMLRGVITNPLDIMNNGNSTGALAVMNSIGISELNVDTFDNYVQIGSSTANTNGTLLVLNNSTTDPGTVVNGAMYYNSTDNSFRCGENGVWRSCVGGLASVNNAVSATITGSTTTQNFTNSGANIGSNYTVLANDCQAGVTYTITANGTYTSAVTGAFTFSIDEDGVSTQLVASGATTDATTGTFGWILTGQMVCISTTSVEIDGNLILGTSATASSDSILDNTGTKTWTTSSHVLSIGVKASAGTPTFVMRQLIVERSGP